MWPWLAANLHSNPYTAEPLGRVSAATIHVPKQTRPLYQITHKGAYQIMATDEEWPTLQPDGEISRILAYVIVPSKAKKGLMSRYARAYLLWDAPSPTSSRLSTNEAEVSALIENGWIPKSSFYLFNMESPMNKNVGSCSF